MGIITNSVVISSASSRRSSGRSVNTSQRRQLPNTYEPVVRTTSNRVHKLTLDGYTPGKAVNELNPIPTSVGAKRVEDAFWAERDKKRITQREPAPDASWMTTEYPESDAALNIVGIALAAIGLFGAGFFLALLLF